MAIELKMPALSPTMEEGTLAKWLKSEGDAIVAGDIIAEIETDKATMEFEAVDEGTLGKILVDEGTEGVKVGTVIAMLAGRRRRRIRDIEAPVPGRSGRGYAWRRQGCRPRSERSELRTCRRKTEVEGPRGSRRHEAFTANTAVREALRDGMAEEMRADERVFVMGEEVAEYQGAYKVTQGLLDEFGPKRVIDTPITEYGFAGIGTGAAMGGLRPIVEFMTFNFAMQAIDHIINSAAKTNYMSGGQMRCPVVFRGPNGAASRVGAQHSQNYGPWYASVPGLVVIAPYDAADAKGLMKAAIRDPKTPSSSLKTNSVYGKSASIVPDVEEYDVPRRLVGKSRRDLATRGIQPPPTLRPLQADDPRSSARPIAWSLRKRAGHARSPGSDGDLHGGSRFDQSSAGPKKASTPQVIESLR